MWLQCVKIEENSEQVEEANSDSEEIQREMVK